MDPNTLDPYLHALFFFLPKDNWTKVVITIGYYKKTYYYKIYFGLGDARNTKSSS